MATPLWCPEDDLLLKTALEEGASLEALAKGAVRFSRKFTVVELRDRWHSLLYDPIVSAEASAHMVELEVSAKKLGSVNKNLEVGSKRELESVRKLYYAMRKRIRRDCNIPELSELTDYLMDPSTVKGSNPGGYMRGDCFGGPSVPAQVFSLKHSAGSGDASVQQKQANGVFRSTCENRTELREGISPSNALPSSSPECDLPGFTCTNSTLPLWKHSEDKSIGGENLCVDNKLPEVGEAMLPRGSVGCTNFNLMKHEGHHDEKMLAHEDTGGQIDAPAPISDKDFVDISDCLLNFANEDDIVPMDIDGKGELCVGQHVKDNKIRIISDSCVVDCPGNDILESTQSPCDAQQVEGNICKEGHVSASAENLDATTGLSNPCHSYCATDSTHSMTETYDEEMACTLNSEDPEIPCNDDILPQTALSCSVPPHMRDGSVTSLNEEKKVEEPSVIGKEENKQDSASVTFQMTEPQTRTDASLNYHHVNSAVKFELSDEQHDGLLKEASARAAISACGLSAGTSGCAKDTMPVEKSSATDSLVEAAENSSMCDIFLLDGSPDETESDPHVPNYDDIEAMILDMDLWPKDVESYASKEVSRYNHEDARRAMIRMEQSARSSIERAIGSRGAFAVLHGHYSNHYIKKVEVILGRSTDDFEVDIDLLGEGGTNRISRRQALIKLEKDGSFSLKNLGKNLMFLNGKEVYSGQCVRLTASCLIEVKGVSFVFEMNEKSVTHYLGKLNRENQRENNGFDWSSEWVP